MDFTLLIEQVEVEIKVREAIRLKLQDEVAMLREAAQAAEKVYHKAYQAQKAAWEIMEETEKVLDLLRQFVGNLRDEKKTMSDLQFYHRKIEDLD